MAWNASNIDGPIPATNGTDYLLNIDPRLMADDLVPFVIPAPDPISPTRVFAGQETIFLKFANEAEALTTSLARQWFST